MNRRRSQQRNGEDGFTLIELLIVCLVLPIVVGSLSLAIISVFSLQSGVSSRLSDSADAQVVSANFVKDVQSALNVTTTGTAGGATQCGSGTPLLSLEWGLDQFTGGYQSVVSYYKVAAASGSAYSLVRSYCGGGAASSPTSTSTLSYDVGGLSSQVTATVAPSTSATLASAGWATSVAITGVTLLVYEPSSKYTYTLVAAPESYSTQIQPAVVAAPTTGCGFATPGTGTYTANLCFVDFSGYNPAKAQAPGCQTMTSAIARTPYTLSFCLSVSPPGTTACANSAAEPHCGTVGPSAMPTYYYAPTSEAFLGNNGFYTDIPGSPALYQSIDEVNNNAQTTTVTITAITVLDANNTPATGWDLVTGDAESTDAGESIQWSSNVNLSLLPNSPTSQFGNACAYPVAGNSKSTPTIPANPTAFSLTGLNSPTVTCSATVNSDKTGTVMLQALDPTSLTVTMVGIGEEGMFLGMMLP